MSGEFIGIGFEMGKNLALGVRHGDISHLIPITYQSNSYGKVSHTGGGSKHMVSLKEICKVANGDVNLLSSNRG